MSGLEAIRTATSEAELRQVYSAALAAAEETDLLNTAGELRRGFIERREELTVRAIEAPLSLERKSGARPARASRARVRPRVEKKSSFQWWWFGLSYLIWRAIRACVQDS